MDAVVPPVARSRELGHRHDLDGGDAEVGERFQVADDGLEGTSRSERPDVQFVEHEVGERVAPETGVGPGKGRRIHDGRRAVHAVGLPARRRIGTVALTIQPILIACACSHAGNRHLEDPLVAPGHGQGRAALEHEVDGLAAGRPHPETDAVVMDACARYVPTVQCGQAWPLSCRNVPTDGLPVCTRPPYPSSDGGQPRTVAAWQRLAVRSRVRMLPAFARGPASAGGRWDLAEVEHQPVARADRAARLARVPEGARLLSRERAARVRGEPRALYP